MKMQRRGLAVAVAVIFTQAISGLFSFVRAQGQPLTFSAFGDIPYGTAEYTLLQKYAADHNRYSPSAFIIHIGDMVTGSCEESKYADVAGMLKDFAVPVYIVVGDNEYNDCSNPTQAFGFWKKYFLNFERNFCGTPETAHQSVRPENLVFVKDGALFIGVNLVGGTVHDQNEWNTRMQQDADWVSQHLQAEISQVRAAVVFAHAGPEGSENNRALFLEQFRAAAKTFGKPVLYIQGNSHSYKLAQPWPEKNITQLVVPKANEEPPLEVTVTMNSNPSSAFTVKRNPWGSTPLNMPPCLNAGADQTIEITAKATLAGEATDDGDPSGTLATMWSQVSGPGATTFANAASLTTMASFGAPGVYVLRLTADDGALQKSDDLTVTVQGHSVVPTLAISDASITEGNSGAADIFFEVTLTNSNGQTTTVDFQIIDDTATLGSDYSVTATFGTLTFPNGMTTRSIKVTIHGDVINEQSDETLLVNLLHATNADIADGQGIGTIINDDTTLPLTAPDNLTASATSSAAISLAWRDNSTDEEGFKIERLVSGGSLSEIATVGGNVNFYNDTGLSASTTYVYRVRAFRASANSDYSNQISATTASVNLGPAFSINDVSINEGNAGTVDVLVAISLANPNGQSSAVDFHVVDGTATRGEDYSVISNVGTITFFSGVTTLRLRVTINGDAVDEQRDETIFVNLANATNATLADHQGVVTILNDDGTVTPPNAPGNLTASATGTTTTSLAWTDNSSAEDGFKIERKINGGSFSEIATVGSPANGINSFNDAELSAGTTYIYRVRAYTAAAHSNYSNEASATTVAPPSFSISDVSINEGNSGTIEVFFVVSLADPHGQSSTVDFQIVDGTATRGDDYSVVASAGAITFLNGVTTQSIKVTIHGDVINEQRDETFFVNLANAANAIIVDGQGIGTIINDDTTLPLESPDQLTASATSSSAIALAWRDNSTDEDGFKIERLVSGGSFSETATVGGNVNFYNDTGLSASTTYVYRVRAFRASANSDYSHQISATTASVNLGPAFSISDVSINEGHAGTVDVLVAVSLTNPNGQSATVDFQIVDGTATRGEDYSIISSAGTMTFFNGGATTQRVRMTILGDATNEPDETVLVNLNNATNATLADHQGVVTIINDDETVTPPNAPGNLTASATGTTTTSLAWSDNSSDEDGFKIERKIDGGTFSEIVSVGSPANGINSFNDTGLSAGTTYVYRVRAFKAALNSGYTNEATATTTSLPPMAPGNLSATATGTATIALAWTDNSTNEDGFKIERKINDGSFSEIATIGSPASGTNSFNDAGLSAGTTYVYRVRAYMSATLSNYSNEASATTSSIGGGGSGNLALNQLVAASSTNPTALKPATNAVDGNALTYWRSAGVTTGNPTAWLRVDLGSPQTVGRVIVKWKDSYHAKSYEIQVANDALNWTTVYSTLAGSKGAQTLTFVATPARYVRILMTKNNKGSYRILEFEVYFGASSSLGKLENSIAEAAAVPNDFVLHQNYPNPFSANGISDNPSTKIGFSLPSRLAGSRVTIKVYTINGVEVATLADDHYAAGAHAIIFQSKNLPSGTYFYVMQAGTVRKARRLMLVK